MTDHSPYTIPAEPGRWRAISLAAAVHAALLVFFWIGIDWQNEVPVAVQAEIWDLQAKEAAPRPAELPDPPQSKPEPKPEPKPESKPIVKETQPAEPDEPIPPKVDIALEKEKKRKEQERKDRLADLEKEKKLKAQADQERQEKRERLEKQAKQEKQAADRIAQQIKKEELDKKRKQDTKDAEIRDKIRADEMRRLTGAVGSGGMGEAAKSRGSGRGDPGYADKIRAKIRSNTIFNVPDNLSGNPAVEFDVELLPDGSLRSEPRLRKASGVSGFDEAVKRAIERSQPFPPDKSGGAPARFTVIHKPKDQ